MDGDPPKLIRVIEALSRLRGDADATVIRRQATNIGWEMNLLKARYAEQRRTTRVGPARDLSHLLAVAKKVIKGRLRNADWIAAWARTPRKTLHAIWRPTVPPIVRKKQDAAGRLIGFKRAPVFGVLSYQAPGVQMLVPKPQDVLVSIKSEIDRIKQIETAERRKRKLDENEHSAIEAIRSAYRELTGYKGGRVISIGKLAGNMVHLGREIDGIFGTKLFAVKDSRRLR